MTYVLDRQHSGFAVTQSRPRGFLGFADAAAPFGGNPALQQWATKLATAWARRVTTKPDEQQRELEKKVDWLAKDYEVTLAGAQKRKGLRKYSSQAIIRAWQTSREQQMDFGTLERSPYLPKTFRPPADHVQLVSTKLVGESDKYPVAPLVVAFMQKLLQLYPQVRADTYGDHGGGDFRGRGFSIDLWLDVSPTPKTHAASGGPMTRWPCCGRCTKQPARSAPSGGCCITTTQWRASSTRRPARAESASWAERSPAADSTGTDRIP